MLLYQNYINNDQLTDFKFVLSLIRAEINKDQANRIRDFLKTYPVDWRFVLSFVEKHRLLPVFYANIKKMGLQSFLPEFVQKNLSYQYLEIIGYNLRLGKKLVEILAVFENRDIPAVPFKGPLLAHSLYGDSTLRYYQDLDILVPKKDVPKCRVVLEESGFFLKEKDLSVNQYNQLLKYGRECDFCDSTGNIRIDLHWQLSAPFRHPYDYEFCKERLQLMGFNNRKIYCLSEEDTLMHLCVNGTYDIWNNLEKILCVADYIKEHPSLDWELVQKLVNHLHCKRMLFLGLFLARDVFEVQFPDKIIEQVEKDKVVRKIAKKIYIELFQGISSKSNIEKRVAEIPYYMKVREHPMDKILYFLRRIFVPTQKDRRNRFWDSRISRLSFLTRPIDLMIELLRAKLKMLKF